MKVLGNKVVVITGGAGALGLVTAKLYLSKGSSVMLVDNDKEALKLAAKTLNHNELAYVVADVTRTSDTRL
ncbi:MAG: SDR family NAD(P)-dependent oxidoreductase [Pedobacter sp.]|uniref:SDR family NAD(P)-dependent oxidoreductase n=1 Tax=Pedobacter sp. TaxID=1411316 RepID=UPI00339AD95D